MYLEMRINNFFLQSQLPFFVTLFFCTLYKKAYSNTGTWIQQRARKGACFFEKLINCRKEEHDMRWIILRKRYSQENKKLSIETNWKPSSWEMAEYVWWWLEVIFRQKKGWSESFSLMVAWHGFWASTWAQQHCGLTLPSACMHWISS